MGKFVYDFEEGNRDLKDLLGGKGANLAEMTNLGLPVPPGFTITTDACREYLRTGELPGGLDRQVGEHLATLEAKMGRRLGDSGDPLLVSVRSGAKFSMPGMMETVLNVGLTDSSVAGLAAQAGGDERFAWDSYRRLIQMFGKTVCDVPGEEFEHALDDAKLAAGTRDDLGLDAAALRGLVGRYKEIFREHTGRDFPQDPREQLGPVRHRVHHRARQAVDAADPGRQADRGGRVRHRHAPRRRGRHRPGRGAAAGQRRTAGAADVPDVRPVAGARAADPGCRRVAIAAQGILTSRGGKTSHAAVVARGMGKTCVCGADDLDVNLHKGQFTVDGHVVSEGDVISVDGTTGRVYLGAVPVQPSPVVQYFEGTLDAAADPLVSAVHRILTHADATRRLKVRTNADTGEDAARARRFGAQGIGLCRTEHMFLGERRALVERLILAGTPQERDAALAELLPLQRDDFVELFRQMRDLPVTVRLIDPPLHEFLPPLEDLAVKVAVAEERGQDPGHDKDLLDAVRRMHEENPMLGLRGVRLGLVIPGLFAMQVRAIVEAAAQVDGARPEIMVPLVGAVQELETIRAEAEKIIGEHDVDVKIGTMIEVPRAALTAGDIAQAADFFSFGTNDLTQMGWGFSRDDVEGAFFWRYLELGIFGVSPFESIDRDGVGRLVRIAVDEGRAARPELHFGVCGEHGGDPESVHFFHEVGLDYVSCSPFRVPVARLEAGRAAVAEQSTSDTR